jgi:cytochrome bd ubiquinol oxidase subunit I
MVARETRMVEEKSGKRLSLISAVIIAIIAYLIFLAVVIVPLQGGEISSTAIFADNLSESNASYATSNIPVQGVGDVSRSAVIAFAMLTHIVFANLQVGGACIIVATALLYFRYQRMRYRNLARSLTLFTLILFSAGSTFAAGGMMAIIALFPDLAMNIFHLYWWPVFIYFLLYGVVITLLFVFWFAWDRFRPGVHLALGFGYAISVFIQTITIDTLAAGMLTPGVKAFSFTESGLLPMTLDQAMALWFNPTLWELTFHRVAAAVAFFGFLIATLATIHYIDQKDFAAKKQWDWVAAYGIAWGLAGLIMQPVLGQMYMGAIQDNVPSAFMMIMHGPRAWAMLMMVTLLSGLFLAIGTYFLTRRDQLLSRPENRTIRTVFKGFLIMTAVSAFILVQPAWLGALFIDDPGAWINPIGGMPLKFVALFVMAAIGAAIAMLAVIILTSEDKEGQWGYLTRGSLLAAFTAGILGTAIVNVMGFVREAARAPWTFYQIIPVPGGQAYATPIPLPVIAGVWVIVLALSWAVFWYVAKVTAYHPTDEESV